MIARMSSLGLRLLLCLCVCLSLSCGGSGREEDGSSFSRDPDKLLAVCTTMLVADLVKQVGGPYVQLELDLRWPRSQGRRPLESPSEGDGFQEAGVSGGSH